MLTKPFFLVTLKKSSMRVCLLRPAASSFFLSSRLLSRIWRNFSIRCRTLSSLKVHQHDHNHCCLAKRKKSKRNSTYLTCLTRQRNPTKASSSGSFQLSSRVTVCGVSKNIFRASLYFQNCGTGWVWGAADTCFVSGYTYFFVMQDTGTGKKNTGCPSGTFLLTCKATFSIVRCFWMSVRALLGPKPAILSQ